MAVRDLIIYDGLCAYKTIKELQKIIGSDILVKTSEEGLDVIKEKTRLFDKWKNIDPASLRSSDKNNIMLNNEKIKIYARNIFTYFSAFLRG